MVTAVHMQVKGGKRMSENQNRDFAKYDAMATEELEEILRSDSQSPEGQESDGELLLYVMGVLAHRKRNSENPGKTAQEAWESFEKHYLPQEEEVHTAKSNRKGLRRWVAAAAAAAVLVAIPLTASALSWDEIWNAVATWAKETFSFVSGGQSAPTEPIEDDFNQYDSLRKALAEAGETFQGIPTWMPDGYTLQDIRVDETPMQKNYIAFYVNGEQRLKITVKSYVAADPEKIEINDELLEVYTAKDTDFYIFSNLERLRAVWLDGSYECSITGDVTMEEIKLMIDSIVKG